MRKLLAATAISLALAAPAQAMFVTNLDHVTHRIAYDVAGHREERVLAPNEVVNFIGLPNGRLSLLSSPHPKTGSKVEAEGMLSGVIGNGRDQGISADQRDDYVIWPGGELLLQRRMKQYGLH